MNPDSIDNYSAGGTPKYDFAHMSEKEARRILSTEGLDVFLDSKEGIECLINNRIKTLHSIPKWHLQLLAWNIILVTHSFLQTFLLRNHHPV